jgi:4-amino-4-deoxy-L-arabinose transferase-like glycosyltransferase
MSALCPASGRGRRRPAPLAAGPTISVAAAVAVLLIALAGAYGYHRDELYFLIAGRHLAWAYPDQGPVTPLIAHTMDLLAPGSLTALRVPAALMSGVTVLMTALIACELGGNRRAQVIAASCTAVAAVTLFVGHLLSTTTLDLLAWATATWLIARIQRTRQWHLWLLVGLVAGIALLNKPLIAFLVAGLGVGMLVAGPREPLRSPWPWGGLLLAVAISSPWLLWQANHHWPQLEVSSAIAAGRSGSSQPRWALIPFQFLLVSPVLAPIWIAGLFALLARERFRRHRSFAVAWAFLALVFLATGGKPYYLAGMFPVLLAAGAIETDAWLARGARRRELLLWSLVVLSGLVSVLLALPVLPARDAGLANSTNSDVGETIGWPELVREIAVVYRRAPRAAVIFTSNYGEAGAVDRYGPTLGLPGAYSGHNGFGYWGPPKVPPGPVVAVGTNARELREFSGCRVAARIENTARIDNSERREPIYLCTRPAATWAAVWPRLRHLG